MAKKLFVGNLAFSTTEEQLRTLFGEAGTVMSVAIITDRMTGQSKGFGFVEMDTDQAAQAAIQKLNGREVNARALVVNEARPPSERSFGGGGRDRGGSRGGSGGRGGGRDRGGRRGNDRGRGRY
jgi:RNA recognition motif-containing protein